MYNVITLNVKYKYVTQKNDYFLNSYTNIYWVYFAPDLLRSCTHWAVSSSTANAIITTNDANAVNLCAIAVKHKGGWVVGVRQPFVCNACKVNTVGAVKGLAVGIAAF